VGSYDCFGKKEQIMRTIRPILAVLLLTTVLAGCQKSTSAPSTSPSTSLRGRAAALRGRYAAPREFQVQASDVSLHARVAGNPGSGCVLIAINGGPGLTSNYMWDLARGGTGLRCRNLRSAGGGKIHPAR